MKKRYGNDAKLFKCNKDKIYYYGSIQDCRTIPLYKVKCPICNNNNCYYCSSHVKYYTDAGNCCIYRRIHCLFFQSKNSFTRDIQRDQDIYLMYYIILFLPLISFMFLIAVFSAYFYYSFIFDDSDEDKHYGEKSVILFFIFVFFNTLFAFCLSIPFFFL